MSQLFTNISQLQDHVGGAINASINIKSIAPSIDKAANDFIIPLVGQAQYTELLNNLTSTTDRIVNLLAAVRRPLAYLAVWQHSYQSEIQFGESGLYRVETESHKSAYKYQINDFRLSMRDSGYDALERLIIFLDANKTDYPLWTADPIAQAKHRNLFLNYAAEVNALYSKRINRYIYETMRPVIEELEVFTLEPLLGQAFFLEMKTKIKANTLSAKEKELLLFLQKALAHFAVLESLKRNIVSFVGDSIVEYEFSEPQSSRTAKTALPDTIGVLARHNDEFGNRNMSKAKWFLETYATDFPTWKTWQDALAASAIVTDPAETEPIDRCCPHCYGHGSGCGCRKKSTVKKIMRL
jgi:hypothetical protein